MHNRSCKAQRNIPPLLKHSVASSTGSTAPHLPRDSTFSATRLEGLVGEGMNHAGQGTGSMLWIGAPCAHCRREDFLPLECGGCHKSFCTAHFAQDTHHCPHRQQSDVRVPICPLCHEPPHGWKRNASAAEVQRIMEAHWSASAGDQRSCAALVPRTSSQSLCSYASCQRALKLAIRCPHCNAEFCLAHRAPTQHACQAKHGVPASVHAWKQVKPPNLPPIKPTVASEPTKSRTPAPTKRPLDRAARRHAAQERQSMIRAMQERNKRGLLTEAEKVVLAQKMAEVAADASHSRPPGPCTVM